MLQGRITDTRSLLVITGGLAMTLLLVQQFSVGNDVRVLVFGALLMGGIAVLKPHFGLYVVLFTLLLLPSGAGQYLGGSRFFSPSTLLAGGAFVGWALSQVLRRDRVILSALFAPFAVTALVLWIAAVRYPQTPAATIAYVFSQGLVLMFLALQLTRNRKQVRLFLVMLALALLAGSLGDSAVAVRSILTDGSVGAIRNENALFGTSGGQPATGSGLRSLLLPLFIAGTVLATSQRIRVIFGLTVLAVVAYLALAASRQGVVGLVLGIILMSVLLPAGKRKGVLLLVPVGVLIYVGLAVYLGSGWQFIVGQNASDLDTLWEEGRSSAWRSAWEAFRQSPLIGHSWGRNHSYFLMHARSMGLTFLVPFIIGLWMIWRHAWWLKRQQLDRYGQILVLGSLAGLLVAIPFNIGGRMFATFPLYYFFILVGVMEAVYIDVRRGGGSFAARPVDQEGAFPLEAANANSV